MLACALDPDRAKEILALAPPEEDGTCTMCGKMCAARTVNRIMEGLTVDLGDDLPGADLKEGTPAGVDSANADPADAARPDQPKVAHGPITIPVEEE